MTPPGRNDPCPCGSGRKYKHCCAGKTQAAAKSFAEAELERGQSLERRGRLNEAMLAYRAAALERPEADSRLGHILDSLGRRAEAVAHFRAAAGSSPGASERRMDLVRALLIGGDDAGARTQLENLTAAEPDNADANWIMGRLLTEAGDFTRAANCYECAIAADPAMAGLYYDLSRIRPFTEEDRPMIGRMLVAARTVEVASERARVHLALAKAFDDLGDYAEAMRHLTRATHIRKALAPLDRAAMAGRVEAVIRRFTPAFFTERAPGGDPSERPVLIVGLPRSGTTLVEQILSSHPDIAGAGELHFWSGRDPLLETERSAAWLDDYQARTARDALTMLGGLAPGARRVIDKNPYNVFWLGPVHAVFPRATIIHTRRHPIDTALSMAGMWVAPCTDYPTDPADVIFYYRQYERLAAHWRAVLPTDRFLEVDYEALVADPEPLTRRLITALDMGWDPACLRPEENPRTVKTNSNWQVRQPIHTGAVERWRRYEPWLGSLRELASSP